MKPVRVRSLISTLLLFFLIYSGAACAKRSRSSSSSNEQHSTASVQNSNARVNINSASVKELAALPGIGPGLAARIIEHREKYGPFRRAEHLMIVRGISERRFLALRDQVSVE